MRKGDIYATDRIAGSGLFKVKIDSVKDGVIYYHHISDKGMIIPLSCYLRSFGYRLFKRASNFEAEFDAL